MKVDLPELKRCCFCIPLRYGLIGWGYIKLIPLGLLFACCTCNLVYIIKQSMRSEYTYIEEIVMSCILLMILATDICFTLVFIVGGHRKSARLLHIYYIYSIVILCLYTLFVTATTALELYYIGKYINYMGHGVAPYIFIIQMKLLFAIVNLGIQVYIILLIRSEVHKLRNSSKYRFSNPTVEAEGTLENGTNEQGIPNSKEGPNVNGTDSQFEKIINQTEKADRGSFNYNKF